MADSTGIMCNFKGCRKVLRKTAWVTSCSHIFCDEDGLKELQHRSGESKCPVCGTHLGHSADVVKADLNPPEHFKSVTFATFIIKEYILRFDFIFRWFSLDSVQKLSSIL
jgi:zinc-RING finger domain